MGWKNVKEHYQIGHLVQVTEEGICIGSPYIHNIIVLNADGKIVKEGERTLNADLIRYQAEMKADPDKLRELVITPDSFDTSISVFTYRGAEIIEKQCEQLGWPNVTHDGDMMFENTFFAEREKALDAAKHNCEAAIFLRQMEISDTRNRLAKSQARLEDLLGDARKLGITVGTTPPPAENVARSDGIEHNGFPEVWR